MLAGNLATEQDSVGVQALACISLEQMMTHLMSPRPVSLFFKRVIVAGETVNESLRQFQLTLLGIPSHSVMRRATVRTVDAKEPSEMATLFHGIKLRK